MTNKIVFICVFLLVGCGNQQNPSNKSTENDPLQETKADSISKAIEVEKAYANKPWKLNTFVDEFGDPTNQKYIETHVDGLFSNSATAGSYLYAEVFFTKTAAGFFLHEYSKTSPAIKIFDAATIMFKNSNAEIFTVITSREWNSSGGIMVKDLKMEGISFLDYTKLRKFIQKSNGEIKVVINDKYSSSYKFIIDTKGFTNEFNLL